MRGIYDGSTTGRRPLLERFLSPFNKRMAAEAAARKVEEEQATPVERRTTLAEQRAQAVADSLHTVPGGHTADGSPKRPKLAANEDLLLWVLKRHGAPSPRPAPRS